jgi:acetyl-CoA C-acetyltransferase
LRNRPGEFGLCSANGGYVTKHAFGIYSTDPPRSGHYEHADPQAAVDALPRRELADDYAGPVMIETYTVMHDRENTPERALVACLTPTGDRTWGNSTDAATMKALLNDEFVGRDATISSDGVVDVV